MGLTTLTRNEERWKRVAEKARGRDEAWERCDDCLRHHPVGYDGACDDPENRLPGRPTEFEHL